ALLSPHGDVVPDGVVIFEQAFQTPTEPPLALGHVTDGAEIGDYRCHTVRSPMISKERSSRGSQRHGGREPAARWSVSWQVILRSPPKGPRVKPQEDIPSPTFWFYAALFRTAVSGGRLPRRSPSRTPLVRRLFCDPSPNLPAAKINASGC